MRFSALFVAAGAFTFAAPVWAQTSEGTTPPNASAAAASDVVILNDGGMVRGTVAEKTRTVSPSSA